MSPAKVSVRSKPVIILLVDDDPDCRALVRDAIARTSLPVDVHEVVNGREALNFLRRRGKYAHAPRPGLIYLDIEMPEMSGREALKAIKSDPDLKGIVVVMLTGVADDEEIRLAARNGANSYTIKPLTPAAFLRFMRETTKYWLCVHQSPESRS